MAYRKTTHRALRLERLEARQMMAGDVTAAVVNGNLMLTGDNLGNDIQIEHTIDTNTWRITGAATTVNGQNEIEISGVTGDIRINLNGGNDRVDFTTSLLSTNQHVNQDLVIETGAGNDTVEIHSAGIGDDLTIDTGAGNDVIDLYFAQIGDFGIDGNHNDLTINTGAGADEVYAEFSGATGDVLIDTGMGGTKTASGAFGFGFTSSADDLVELAGFGANGYMTVRTGDGNDTVNFDTAGAANGLTIETGDGNDSVSIEMTMGEKKQVTDGNLVIDLGLGDDALSVGRDVTVGGRKVVRGL